MFRVSDWWGGFCGGKVFIDYLVLRDRREIGMVGFFFSFDVYGFLFDSCGGWRNWVGGWVGVFFRVVGM